MSEILSLEEHISSNEDENSFGIAQLWSDDQDNDRPAAVPTTEKQSDERIEDLVSLFRDFLEAAPNKAVSGPSHPVAQQNNAGRKRFFGLAKGFSPETGSNDRYDYEQKYPRDRFGEEVSDNSRVWLTYLDEAEAFDRERVEGWKETVDVFLVFAGLFSGVITTFISQASQSLQKDNTQVSASLLSEASPFTASTNTLLVNGLWFTSLAITLSTALFAVLTKQWLYYYLSSISGTANQKVRARQLRFNGFESWKLAAIVELLPILLHVAVGLFLTGIIILLFPLEVHVAWTIVVIAGITFTLYFVSVLLPIWYPECPYTTSLTIYIGILFFILRQMFQKITEIINKGFQAIWGKIHYKTRHTVVHLVRYGQCVVEHGFMFSSMLAGAVRRGFQKLRFTIFSDKLPEFTKWREENIKKAIENATFLDFEALKWLYATSQNRSVQRIIARCAAVHPIIKKQFEQNIRRELCRTLEIGETNLVDIRHGLCLNFPDMKYDYQELLRSISNISDVVENALVAVHILTDRTLFVRESFDPTRNLIRNAGLVHFGSKELVWWKFEYLFRYFELGTPDYSSEAKTYETCYLLLIAIYRNLTSDDPIITDEEQRQGTLTGVFIAFPDHRRLISTGRLRISDASEAALRFFREICCVDSFWCESMTDFARFSAMNSMNLSITHLEKSLSFADSHDLSLIYQWYSRSESDPDSDFSHETPPLLVLLLVPQNRHHLSTFLLNDSDPLFHFSTCLRNLTNYRDINKDKSLYRILMDLLKSVGPKDNTLYAILYDPSALLQLWKLLVYCKWDTKRYFLLVETKIDREKLDKLFAAMNELVRSSDDLANLPYKCRLREEYKQDVRSALAASAREFGQLIGQPESTADQSASENAPSDHNNEERAQVPAPNERKFFNSIGNWMKKTSESIWLRIPRKTSNQSTTSPIPLSETNPNPTA